MIRVTVWNEYRHEKIDKAVSKLYPEGLHGKIAEFLSEEEDFCVKTATLDMPQHGLSDEVLGNTDVLIWWGHMAHDEVSDEIVEKLYKRINDGMGFIALHSAHYSKIFKKLMGTYCKLQWRLDDRERLWCIKPAHPIAVGIPEVIDIEKEEMYGEPFLIPEPDELIFIGSFSRGEVFRSGCTYYRGHGKIFYFQPGHEGYPVFYNKDIQRIIKNAVRWTAPQN